MEVPAVNAGPSRRRHDPSPHDLANRIVALQRKNASAPGPSRLPTRRYDDVDEFSRGANAVGPGPSRALYDPSAPMSPTPRQQELRNGESSRGIEEEYHRQSRSKPEHSSKKLDKAQERQLFIPDIHDPHHFHPNPNHPSHQPHQASSSRHQLPQSSRIHPQSHSNPQSQSASYGHLTPSEGGSSGSRSLLRRPGHHGRTPEEEADRERERRRRREGSERGSLHSKRKEGDSKSKGSRSSDGSESLRDRERGKAKADTGVKSILRDIHNKIRALEAELNEMHKKMQSDPEAGISVLLDEKAARTLSREGDTSAWMDLISKHKELADLHHLFLVRVFDPLIPSTFQQLAVKYNIPSRLWQVSFHLILERLRHAWMTAHPAALDLLTDLVYDAYKFYTDLLEDQAMTHFRTAWIEALGDLARYRMAIASHVGETSQSTPYSRRNDPFDDDELDGEQTYAEPSGASIGAEVAQSWDVEDKETWRTTARDWYSMGITEKPGEGRLHHHLALICRGVKGEELRSLHHFAKSLVVTHEYETSRESILGLFDTALQTQRYLPEATAVDLFVLLHGMMFTKIELDNFPLVMSRFMERLEEDKRLDNSHRRVIITQVDWMLMSSVNLASLLQYGSTQGVIRRRLALEGQERRRAQAVIEDEGEIGDAIHGDLEEGHPATADHPPVQASTSSPTKSSSSGDSSTDMPISMTHAIDLTLTIFSTLLEHPTRQQGLHSVLNPYITIIFTFLATIFRQHHVGSVLLPYVPWQGLVRFLNTHSEILEIKEETRLASGPPLPEDWTVRGMEWVGRRVYERGFWKIKSSSRGSGGMAQPRTGERLQSEMDVLISNFDSTLDISEGIVDDGEGDGADAIDGPVAVNQRRWKRVGWAAGVMVKHIDGLSLLDGKVVIEGALKARLDEIEAVRVAEKEQEAREAARRREKEKNDEIEEILQAVGSDSDVDDPELAVLRERRSKLRSMLDGSADRSLPPIPRSKKPARKSINVVPGYTMLVFDTNVLLSSLSLFEKVVEGGKWSAVVPLPVITELDGLAKNASSLGSAAAAAISYLESHVRSHCLSLKIQTSRGNYLTDLLIRKENHDLGEGDDARTMDDLILNVASFQSEHFVDRSNLLKSTSQDGQNAGVGRDGAKVLLVTFDRNLRLRARGKGIETADEKEIKSILGQ